jgi:hypothetical protein
VDVENLPPMRIEYIRRGQVTMVATPVEVWSIQGSPPPVR